MTLPPHPDQVFAVIRVKGFQYKVTKDDRVVLEMLSSSRSAKEHNHESEESEQEEEESGGFTVG